MKNLFHISLIILLTVSCSDSNEINYIDFENISNFSISITTPEKKNDFTYHNNGVLGLFYNPDTPIRFEGEIDLNLINPSKPIDPSNIKIKWSSSLDGIISEEVSSDEYKSSFEKIISKNIHTIYFEVSINDNPDFTRKDSIVISNVIRLELEPTDRSIKLKWSKYEGSNFESYLIYRENHDPLIEISNINILEYEDFDITLAEVKNFQIVVKTSDNLNIVYGSNIEEGESGKYVKIPYFVTKTIKDRHRNKIYAIVGDDYSADYGLIILDNNSEKVEINSYLLKESRFSDLDISSDGKYLYLCQKWVDKITRLDLNSFEITSFDVSYGGWGIHKIEVGNNYRLYCHRTPPTSGNSSLYILDGTNGNKVGEYYWADHGDIEFNIFNNKLYHSKSVTSNKILIKFSVDNDSFTHDVVFAPDIPFPRPFLLLSEDGQHLFWEKFQLDKSLNIIREFEENIISSNSENTYFSDGIKLMTFDNSETVFNYPLFPLSDEKSNEIFMDDNSIVISKSYQPWTNVKYTYIFKFKTTPVQY